MSCPISKPTALLETREAEGRRLLVGVLREFIDEMRHKGFPGVERTEVTDGYKQGFRDLLTPKYAKENRIAILGWHVRTSDFTELVNDPEWRELLHFTWLTVSVDGDLYDHYMWIGGFVGGLSGYRKVDSAELVGESIAALKLRAPDNPGLGSYHQFITKTTSEEVISHTGTR